MRRNDREIKDRGEIDSIIGRARVCRLALCRDGQPYIVPLCFGYDGRSLYFHAAEDGMKIEALDRVAVIKIEIESLTGKRSGP